jgi:protein-arginine kinase
MNASRLRCPKLPEDQAAMIVSTRIRVGRNLKGYPLGPGISNKQRNEIMYKLANAFSMFKDGKNDDLVGKFYSLNTLSFKERRQLVEDHFLFKEGDRFLEACGLNRDWPNGRGIYHNAAKTFLIWVNEEDQLRVISMQKGADLHEVFERLSRACSIIQRNL